MAVRTVVVSIIAALFVFQQIGIGEANSLGIERRPLGYEESQTGRTVEWEQNVTTSAEREVPTSLLYLEEAAGDVNKFRRCYYTSVETHCFDAQYDTTNNRWLNTTFDNARKRCLDLNSTLLIIKDEETNEILRQYFNEPNNPITGQYVWTDAYRFSDFSNTHMWHWVDSTLPTVKASDVTNTPSHLLFYVAVIEFRDNSYYLTANYAIQGCNYICEYPASKCPSSSSNNVRQFNGRCYAAIIAQVYWYEARNRCIKDGGDLASFVNVTSINFTSWLDAVPNTRYYIGLRFKWYIWIDTGENVKYSYWTPTNSDVEVPCLRTIYGDSSLSWQQAYCTADANILCHTVTPISQPTTSSTSNATASATITTTRTSTSPESFQNTSKESSEGRATNGLAIGVGVGVGVGVPILIALTVLITCIVVRSKTCFKNNTSNDAAELDTVGGPSIGQVKDAVNDQYQQLNFNLDKSPETTYDKPKVEPEQPYEELQTNII